MFRFPPSVLSSLEFKASRTLEAVVEVSFLQAEPSPGYTDSSPTGHHLQCACGSGAVRVTGRAGKSPEAQAVRAPAPGELGPLSQSGTWLLPAGSLQVRGHHPELHKLCVHKPLCSQTSVLISNFCLRTGFCFLVGWVFFF